MGLLVLFTRLGGFHFEILSRDPIQLLNGKFYFGLLSNTGIVFWCGAASILFFTAKLSFAQSRPKKRSSFFIVSGLLTLLMLIDDLFLLHDVIFPDYLNIDEKIFYVIYGLSVILIFYFYFQIIMKSDYILLLLAFGLLAITAFVDVLIAIGIDLPYPYAIEDGCKFLGIISWFIYFTRTCYKYIKHVESLD